MDVVGAKALKQRIEDGKPLRSSEVDELRSRQTGGSWEDCRPPAPPAARAPREQSPLSSYADDPMARLWQNAGDRETGAEAVEAVRARRRNPDSKQ
jgi:hypothetical protein